MQKVEILAVENPAHDDGYQCGSIEVSKPSEKPKGYLIEFENIFFVLKNGTAIMKDVIGQYKPGRMCAIIGPSGAGIMLYEWDT